MIIGEFKTVFDADIKGFTAAAKGIHDATNRTTRAFKNLSAAGQENAKAYARQELSMKRAWTQTLSMTQSIKQLNIKEAEQKALLDQVGVTLANYTKQLNSGALSTHQLNRATAAFAKEMRELGNQIRATQAATNTGHWNKLTNALRNLESASVLAVGPLSGIGARLRSLSAITSRTTLAMAAMFGTVTAGLVGFYKLAEASVRINAEISQTEARLLAASGKVRQVGKDMTYLADVSMKFGLDFVGTAKSFSRFAASAQGTALEGEKARRVFEGITKAGAALRLSSIEMEGIFRAVEQMMSKGTVQAEELRGQLGERLPGAFRLAAEAMGVNTIQLNKMLKNGEILAEDMLPKLARHLEETFGANAEDNAKTLQGAWNNLVTQFKLFANEVNDSVGITEALVAIIKELTDDMEDLAGNLKVVIKGFQQLSEWQVLARIQSKALSGDLIGLTGVWGKLWAAMRKANEESEAADKAMSGGGMTDTIEQLEALTAAALEVDATVSRLVGASGFSTGFQETADEVIELVDALEKWAEVQRLMGKGVSMELALLRVEFAAKVASAEIGDLGNMARELSDILGFYVAQDAESVAAALAVLADSADRAEDKTNGLTKAAEALADAEWDLLQLRRELEAARQGEEQYRIYKDITSQLDELERQLLSQGIAEADVNRILAERLNLMVALTAEQQRMKDAAEAHKQTLKDEESLTRAIEQAQESQARALDKANELIDQMHDKVYSLGLGAQQLRYFEEVSQPIARMRFELEKAGVAQAEINARVAEYQALLTTVYNMTGPLAQAADEISESLGQGFEDAIMQAKSFEEAMKDMIKEIYRTLLRTLIIDPIVEDLQTQLKRWFTQNGTQGTVPSILGGLFGGGNTPLGGGAGGIQGAPGTTSGTGVVAGAAGAAQQTAEAAAQAQEAAIQAQWQAILAQFQATVTQFQAVVTQCQAACTTLQTGATTFTTAATTFGTATTTFAAAANAHNVAASALSAAAVELTTAAATLASSGAASNVAGSFALGGHARRGRIYEVNENGPEMFYSRGRQYLMPHADGDVEPMSGAGGGGRGRGIVVNQTINLPPEKTRRTTMQYAQETARITGRATARNG